jgi:hypothetical protein
MGNGRNCVFGLVGGIGADDPSVLTRGRNTTMRIRKRLSLCLIGAAVLTLSAALPTSAQQSDTVTVTGETVSSVSLVLTTESVSFGQITEPGRKTTTAPVTGAATATFTGSALKVTRNVTTPPAGFATLQVNSDGGLRGVENSTVSDPSAINDIFYLEITGSEPRGLFSYVVTYTASTI